MPTVSHRGCNIYYRVSGAGPLLLLQHGFFGSHADWKHFGYVDALKQAFTVVTLDSLAHGNSDKPTEMTCYQLEQRAGDVVAVMDDLGCEQAHLIGYSMGGWIATGVALHYPERLASAAIGGWNCVQGMSPGLMQGAGKPRLSFGEYMSKAEELSPANSLAWVQGDTWTALACCYEHLYDVEGGADAITRLDVPVLLYAGEEDFCHDPMQTFAAKHRMSFLSLPGDHMSAMRHGASRLASVLKNFPR